MKGIFEVKYFELHAIYTLGQCFLAINLEKMYYLS